MDVERGEVPAPRPPIELPADALCSAHRDARATFLCARCGSYGCKECVYFVLGESTICCACGPRESVPWERRSQLGWWRAFWDTTKLVRRSPVQFFKTPSMEPGMTMPVAYGLAAYTVGQLMLAAELSVLMMIVGLVVTAIGGDAEGMLGGLFLVYGVCMFAMIVPLTLVQAPVYGLFGIMLSGGLCHLTLVALKKRTATFEQTLRAVSYANAPYTLAWIPCVGMPIALVWVIVAETLAIRETHKVSTRTAAFSVIAHRIVVVGLVAGGYAALIALTMWLDTRQP